MKTMSMRRHSRLSSWPAFGSHVEFGPDLREVASLIGPMSSAWKGLFWCPLIPAQDERLDMAFAGPRLVLAPAGVNLEPFRPDLIALAGCGESGGGLARIAPNSYGGFWVGLEVVVPRRVLGAAKVGRDQAHTVRV